MDMIGLLRMLGALVTVLGLLVGALWMVRRYNIVLPGAARARTERRLEVVERLAIDPRRSLALLRRDGREHLVLLSPEGHMLIESGIVPDRADEATTKAIDAPHGFAEYLANEPRAAGGNRAETADA